MDAETRREIFRRRKEGHTLVQIATQMGLRRDYVTHVARERLSTVEIRTLLDGWKIQETDCC